MTLEKIAEINTHKELKEYTQYILYLTLTKEISPEQAKSLCMLIKQHSIEIDKAKNEIPFWNI
ncbi:MAG: hypothetical protein WC313_09930 [Candidatus Kapaibacterium sp.]